MADPFVPFDVMIDGYVIDAAISENHQFDSEVTDHPVESGADITDHIRIKPIVVTINGIVSDTPIGSALLARDKDASGGVATPPSEELLALALGIRDVRQPVTISTTLQDYDDMVLQTFTVPRDAKTGRSIVFTAVFKQIRVVTTDRALVRVANPTGAKKSNLGNKSAVKKPDPPEGYYSNNNPDGADVSLSSAIADYLGVKNKVGASDISNTLGP